MLDNGKETWTYTLTEETVVIDSEDGLTRISVYNSSAVDGTVTGTKTVSGLPSQPLTIAQGETATISVEDGYVLDGITIVAPASCTLQIAAN